MPLRGDRLRWPPRPGKKSVDESNVQGTRRALATDENRNPTNQPMRQPNERDESADEHSSKPRPIIKRAHDDLAQGQQDTDCRNQSGQTTEGATKSRHDQKGSNE